MIAPDVSVQIGVDLNAEPACEHIIPLDWPPTRYWLARRDQSVTCSKPAEWVHRMNPCGHSLLACDPHRALQAARVRGVGVRGWGCRRCGASRDVSRESWVRL